MGKKRNRKGKRRELIKAGTIRLAGRGRGGGKEKKEEKKGGEKPFSNRKRKILYHITIEAVTPLHLGSGKVDFFVDKPVRRDWNRLPMIPGSSLAGLFRELYPAGEVEKERLFGYQKGGEGEENGAGSQIIFTNGLLVGRDRQVIEGVTPLLNDPFLLFFRDSLPIRERTAIDESGTAKEHFKFDEEVVPVGTQFKFGIELEEGAATAEVEENLLKVLWAYQFRIGGGATRGLGKVKVVEILRREIEVGDPEERRKFASLNSSAPNRATRREFELIYSTKGGWQKFFKSDPSPIDREEFIEIELELEPEGSFITGDRYPEGEIDIQQLREVVVDYSKPDPTSWEKRAVLPGSGIKGALAHRVAFYFNLENGYFGKEGKVGSENRAVREIFGVEKGNTKGDEDLSKLGNSGENSKPAGKKGIILLEDLVLEGGEERILTHVSIDRFLGGALEQALFTEKVLVGGRGKLKILVKKEGIGGEVPEWQVKEYFKFLKLAIEDLLNGQLPLGGGGSRGHGIFTGTGKGLKKLVQEGAEGGER